MLKQLSGLDAAFLYMETASSFGHVNSLSIYERPDNQDFNPFEAARAQVESRLDILEPFRRRLIEVPFELDHPYWISDPDFDLDFHVRHIAIPPPGDDFQLGEQVARIIGRPMDRSRPLWEIYVLEGLESGDYAMLAKFHHATIDGAAGAQFSSILLDRDPEVRPEPSSGDWPRDRVPTDFEMFNRTLVQLALRPGKVVRLQVKLLREMANLTRSQGFGTLADTIQRSLPGSMGSRLRQLLSGPEDNDDIDIPPPLPTRAAPSTPFNQSITAHRRFAFRSVPLADIKALKNAMGVTLNDVVMAVCAGALRRYLLDQDVLPDRPLVAGIPVSLRTGDEKDPWTNRISTIFANLPTDAEEPLDRVKAVHDAMGAAKEQFEMLPADLLSDVSDLIPTGLATRAVRLATRLHLGDRVTLPFNLIISNVPGPRDPLYMGGSLLKHYFPVSTIVEGQGLNITVQSYVDSLDFGLVACRELVPDLWRLADHCVEEVDLLFEAAGVAR
jgi:diacylglycerol O-acyltransferase